MAGDDQVTSPGSANANQGVDPDSVSILGLGCGDDPCPPPIDFMTFVTSLSASAAFHLGLMPDPDTNVTNLNIPLARQTIDILQMLREKTLGNLNPDEQHQFDVILYDLKMRFIQRVG
jgi:hypothetical protein